MRLLGRLKSIETDKVIVVVSAVIVSLFIFSVWSMEVLL